MPVYNNIPLTKNHVQVPPEGHEDGEPFHVHVDGEFFPALGGVALHSVRRPDGTEVMLTAEGKDEVKRRVHLRHEDNNRSGMEALGMYASVGRGMFG
jgi:hypothetical protein